MPDLAASQPLDSPEARALHADLAGAQTLLRGLVLVRAVAVGARTLQRASDATGITRSTCHRLLQALTQAGYLRHQAGEYFLGPTLMEMGFRAVEQSPVTALARPILQQLVDVQHDTVHLGIRDGGAVLYLDKISGSRGVEMRSRVGQRMPLSRTGVGKALLLDSGPDWDTQYDIDHEGTVTGQAREDFLRRMRTYAEAGVAWDLEENEIGIRCVAAPVRDASGAITAAISMSATSPYMPTARMRSLSTVMRATADRISRALGHQVDRDGLEEQDPCGTRTRGAAARRLAE
ncbi:IclR family transcriptional regulator [Arsenicicoccus dermatophilus]|uniref:IclR family transcriptional regulator n=1 Tax=Arsenicicoccus dermatophilus TaxID=1076331 RepID=UPI001F4D03B0|nr:IclR family transcriptional regulator [Arsenicicoccus dermatophilus]MCH8611547.1 IclR family transcriptional regulator [Arsenicicoccus dermatophilus]